MISNGVQNLVAIGALTNKKYAFKGRSWELITVDSFDFFDVFATEVQYDIRGSEILRVLPRTKGNLNYDWITDKIRYAFDGLNYQRLTVPYVRQKNGTFLPLAWSDVLEQLAAFFANTKQINLSGRCSGFLDLVNLVSFKNFLTFAGSTNFYHVQNNGIFFSKRQFYLSSLKKFQIFNTSQGFLLFCYNPRLESPILNLRLKQLTQTNKQIKIFSFGFTSEVLFKVVSLGTCLRLFCQNLGGFSALSKFLYSCKNLSFIVGTSVWTTFDRNILQIFLFKFIPYFMRKLKISMDIVYIPFFLSQLNSLEINFNFTKVDFYSKKSKVGLFINTESAGQESFDFLIYHGHHFPLNYSKFNFLLPAKAPLEYSQIFISIFGNVKTFLPILPTINEAKDITNVLRLFCLFFDGLSLLYIIKFLFTINTNLLAYFSSKIFSHSYYLDSADFWPSKHNNFFDHKMYFYNNSVSYFLSNFYLSDGISKFSPSMALGFKRFSKSFF